MKHILVVDDCEEIRDLISAYLEDAGYQVSAAESGAKAEQICREIHLDLVLCDLVMPARDGGDLQSDMGGLQVIKAISNASPDLPIVAMSGHISQELLDQVRTAGAAEALPKPFTPEQLLEVIGRVLS